MAEIINMPRLSDTMEEGVVAKWLVNIGDKVSEGDILAEIETDKATMEFESFHEGTLLHIGIKEGETAAVDTLLAVIGDEGEDVTELLSPSKGPVQLDLVDQINETVAPEKEEVQEEEAYFVGPEELEAPEKIGAAKSSGADKNVFKVIIMLFVTGKCGNSRENSKVQRE